MKDHFLKELLRLQSFQEDSIEEALVESFHNIDHMLNNIVRQTHTQTHTHKYTNIEQKYADTLTELNWWWEHITVQTVDR